MSEIGDIRLNLETLENVTDDLFESFSLIDDLSFSFYEEITEKIYNEIKRETLILKRLEEEESEVQTND